jgi:hypothetical protein
MLQLDFVHDQAIKHLPLEFAARWQRCSLLLQLSNGEIEAGAQFMQRDHLVIDDGNDAVGGQRFIRWLILGFGAERADQAEDYEDFAKQGRHEMYPLFIED